MSRSFAEALRESKTEKYQCRCGYVSEPGKEVWEYRNPAGKGVFVDCPECRGYATVEEVIRDPESGKVIRCEQEEPSLARMVKECLREDQRKGEKGGGSKSGKSRKKPLKRLAGRVEQDSFSGLAPQKDKSKTKRLKKSRKTEFYVSLPCYTRICEEQRIWETLGRKSTVTNIVRSVLTARNLINLENIAKVTGAKHRFTLQLTTEETDLVDHKARDYESRFGDKISRGDVFEALLEKFRFGVD